MLVKFYQNNNNNNKKFKTVLITSVILLLMGPHISCFYSDKAMHRFGIKALAYSPGVKCCKRFRNNIFCLWNYSLEELQKLFGYMNNVDTTGKIKFTVSVANELVLKFVGLCLHIDERNKICVDVFAKPTNSYVCITIYLSS